MLQIIKDNIGFLAFVVSIISILISLKRYRAQLATITKTVKLSFVNNDSRYKATITLKDINEQIEIKCSKLFKKKYFIYKSYSPNPIILPNGKNIIVGSKDIDLDFLRDFDKGKYKIIFYTNRHPRKLKTKIKVPYDTIFDKPFLSRLINRLRRIKQK